MEKYILLCVLLITTITLSAQQRSLMSQTGARVAEQQTFQTAAHDEAALLEELYLAEEMAAFDLGPAPERMLPGKVTEVRGKSNVDISRDTKAPQSKQSKPLPAFAQFPHQVSGQRSKPFSMSGNQSQAPGLLSIIPKLFLSFPRIFKMIGK